MTVTREVTWGQAIVVEAFKCPGGLNVAVDHLQHQLGPAIGSRNTFRKFLLLGGPGEVSGRDRFRVWALLAAFGCEPAEWGIPDDVVPASLDAGTLKVQLRARRDSNPQPSDPEADVWSQDDDVVYLDEYRAARRLRRSA